METGRKRTSQWGTNRMSNNAAVRFERYAAIGSLVKKLKKTILKRKVGSTYTVCIVYTRENWNTHKSYIVLGANPLEL